MIGTVAGNQREAGDERGEPDHHQQEVGQQVSGSEFDHPGQELGDVRGEEVQVPEQAELDHRVLDLELDDHEGDEGHDRER